MATIEEMQTIVAGLTQEYINKASFEEKIKLSLDSIELCIAEHADKRIPRCSHSNHHRMRNRKPKLRA